MRLRINTREVGEVSVLDVTGNLEIGQKLGDPLLHVKELLATDRKKILLNLANSTLVDIAGAGAIVSCHTYARRHDGQLKVVIQGNQPRELFRVNRLDDVLEVYYSEKDALASFS